MRVSAAITNPRVEQNQYSRMNQIKLYGQKNDYPQKILEIINASGTGKVCVDLYIKFIRGAGFNDERLNTLVINDCGERMATMLSKCASDLRKFNGFAMLVKYNGLMLVDELYNIPFEHCRIEIDNDRKYTGRIGVHPDWTNMKGLTFKKEDIKFLTRFNPFAVPDEVMKYAAGNPADFCGQIYYFTADGDFEYPICPFDAIVTDMLTEESVSTVKYRNAKHNFLPAGILVRKGIKPKTLDDGSVDEDDPGYQQQIASADEIKKMQGDENTAKIWVVDVDADEEKPEFIPFTGKNYDRQFELTENTVQENIGRMSMIPPILRGVDVGSGFGADLMKNAYDFMNSITSDERNQLELCFMDMFQTWPEQYEDFSIKEIEYVSNNSSVDPAFLPDLTQNERRALAGFNDPAPVSETVLAQIIGVGGTTALIAIVNDQVMIPEQKIQLLIKLFNFNDEDARKIIQPVITTTQKIQP
jgi:hypothetical protein